MVSVGTIVWLSSELMFFAALFAMFFAIRSADYSQWELHYPILDLPYAVFFTTVLVLSSVTCQIGVLRAERGNVHALRRWFALTFVMGLIFLLGQVNEYRNLVHEGIKINADGYGSMFYLTTGFHGLHVTGGVIYLLSMVRWVLNRPDPAASYNAVEIAGLYWHFVDLVWIMVFTFMYLL
jgi:cytochrome c oxidase subunit III